MAMKFWTTANINKRKGMTVSFLDVVTPVLVIIVA